METIKNFLKQLRLSRVVTVFLAVFVLFVSTACNSGNVQGARPGNPPVQAGGQNNPYKAGGDSYTNYKQSPDPKVSRKDQAALPNTSQSLLADNRADSELIYPASKAPAPNRQFPVVGKDKATSILEKPSVPAVREPLVDRSDPNANILERSTEAVQEASAFLKVKADEALERPELQINPATHD